MITLYGIPNCDTVKKAVSWLKQHDLSFHFHDYKKEGISRDRLKEWCIKFGWETVLNKKGTTWKKLDDAEKTNISNGKKAIEYLAQNTSAIKRPVIETETLTLIGFSEAAYEGLL